MPILFFISRKLYFWSVDETCVLEICKYTNLIETNDFFTSAISTLPVIFIILTKTFCLLQYSFLFKTQAISSTTFLTSFFTKIGTIYCSKGRLNLMRTFFCFICRLFEIAQCIIKYLENRQETQIVTVNQENTMSEPAPSMWSHYENFFRSFVFDLDACCTFEINCLKEK